MILDDNVNAYSETDVLTSNKSVLPNKKDDAHNSDELKGVFYRVKTWIFILGCVIIFIFLKLIKEKRNYINLEMDIANVTRKYGVSINNIMKKATMASVELKLLIVGLIIIIILLLVLLYGFGYQKLFIKDGKIEGEGAWGKQCILPYQCIRAVESNPLKGIRILSSLGVINFYFLKNADYIKHKLMKEITVSDFDMNTIQE